MKQYKNESFSVYNIENDGKPQHPLSFLEGDRETGWHVARNLVKPLNHLDSQRRKEQIAQKLRLHNIYTPKQIFRKNFLLLQAHQQKRCSTELVINQLAKRLPNGSAENVQQIKRLLRGYASIKHMEFHPSDVCNLTCKDCTYGHDEDETKPLPINFRFESIERISQLSPQSMVIIGGGEPTLYVHKKRRFQEMNEELFLHLPNIALALVTNGNFSTRRELAQ